MSYSLPQVYKKPVSALYYLALYRNVDNMHCILIHGVIKLNLVITEVHLQTRARVTCADLVDDNLPRSRDSIGNVFTLPIIDVLTSEISLQTIPKTE